MQLVSSLKIIILFLNDNLETFDNYDHLGWGHLRQNGEMSNILQQVQLPVISNIDCKEKFQNVFRHQTIPDIRLNETSVICAGFEIGGRDACQGDSFFFF